MNKHIIIVLAVLISPIYTNHCVCDERSGMITGFGTTIAPLVYTSQIGEGPDVFTNRGPKVGLNFCMGFAVDHRNVVVMMTDFVFPEDPEALGYLGPVYFHYFSPSANSVYLVGGLGAQLAAWPGGGDWGIAKFRVGPALKSGLGLEILPQILCDLTTTIGRTSRHGISHFHIQISLNLRFHTN
jgi:hypothetical protein